MKDENMLSKDAQSNTIDILLFYLTSLISCELAVKSKLQSKRKPRSQRKFMIKQITAHFILKTFVHIAKTFGLCGKKNDVIVKPDL
jgi:hypothetical protein